jgi:hypothetical protein
VFRTVVLNFHLIIPCIVSVCICSIFAGALLVGGLYNVFWGKSIEEREDLNKISAAAGKPGGLELPQQQDKADEASQEVLDDDAEAKV